MRAGDEIGENILLAKISGCTVLVGYMYGQIIVYACVGSMKQGFLS